MFTNLRRVSQHSCSKSKIKPGLVFFKDPFEELILSGTFFGGGGGGANDKSTAREKIVVYIFAQSLCGISIL